MLMEIYIYDANEIVLVFIAAGKKPSVLYGSCCDEPKHFTRVLMINGLMTPSD